MGVLSVLAMSLLPAAQSQQYNEQVADILVQYAGKSSYKIKAFDDDGEVFI